MPDFERSLPVMAGRSDWSARKSMKNIYDFVVLVAIFGGTFILCGLTLLAPLLLLYRAGQAMCWLVHKRKIY